jgi:hypothetical protein
MKNLKKFNESLVDNIYIKSVEVIKDITPLKAGTKIEFKNN